MPELEELSGFRYLKETRYDRETIRQLKRPAVGEAKTCKSYPDAKQVELPRHWQLTEARITPLLQQRRSLRKYAREPLKFSELAFLLWASQGVTAKSANYSFRTAPSGGALYPVETYFSANNVEGLSQGIYHFDVENFRLERLDNRDCSKEIATACMNQKFMAESAVTFLWSVVFRRTISKYGNRGMRYILLDTGHVCQNLLIGAEAVGCGGCPVAAFYDTELNSILGLDESEESVIYAAAVGKKTTATKQCSL